MDKTISGLPELIRDFVKPRGSFSSASSYADSKDSIFKIIDIQLNNAAILPIVQFALSSIENTKVGQEKRFILQFPEIHYEIEVHGGMFRQQLEQLADFVAQQREKIGISEPSLAVEQQILVEKNLSEHFHTLEKKPGERTL
jgi:hypothetical protein